MPVARCLNEELEACVADLERKHRIISVQVSGNAAVVLYEPKRQQTRETRTAKP